MAGIGKTAQSLYIYSNFYQKGDKIILLGQFRRENVGEASFLK